MRGLAVAAAALAPVLGASLVAGAASAQQKSLKDQLVGTWTLTGNYAERADGSRMYAFGKDPKGIFMLDAGGRFSYLIAGGRWRQRQWSYRDACAAKLFCDFLLL